MMNSFIKFKVWFLMFAHKISVSKPFFLLWLKGYCDARSNSLYSSENSEMVVSAYTDMLVTGLEILSSKFSTILNDSYDEEYSGLKNIEEYNRFVYTSDTDLRAKYKKEHSRSELLTLYKNINENENYLRNRLFTASARVQRNLTAYYSGARHVLDIFPDNSSLEAVYTDRYLRLLNIQIFAGRIVREFVINKFQIASGGN